MKEKTRTVVMNDGRVGRLIREFIYTLIIELDHPTLVSRDEVMCINEGS